MKAWYAGVVGSALWGANVYGQKGPFPLPKSILVQSGFDAVFVAKGALFISILLMGTILLSRLFKFFFKIPPIAGQIMGGIVLGPSLIDLPAIPLFLDELRFTDTVTKKLYFVVPSDLFVFFILLLSSAFTVAYLLWLAGYETNVRDLAKVGGTAVGGGVLGAVMPIGMIVLGLQYFYEGTFSTVSMIGIGIVFAATSVSIPVAMLVSSGRMHLKSSQATLGAAVVDDIIAVIILSVFMMGIQSGVFGKMKGITTHGGHTGGIFMAIMHMILSGIVIISFGYFVIPPAMKKLQDLKLSHLLAPVATGIMLLYFAFAELAGGLAGITGAYFAGLFHRMTDKRGMTEKVIAPFVNSILLPLFLGSIGLQVNVRILTISQWWLVFFLLFISIVSKLIGCFIAGSLSNLVTKKGKSRWTALEMYIFGSSMVARGEVGLVVATILRGSQIISAESYVLCVVVIILTTVAAPIMLSIGFYWLDKLLEKKGNRLYKVNIGKFKLVGTQQMFNIIGGFLEAHKKTSTRIRFSEGRKIIDVEGHDIQVIFSPNKGISFEGNREKILQLISEIKQEVIHEFEGISSR